MLGDERRNMVGKNFNLKNVRCLSEILQLEPPPQKKTGPFTHANGPV